ncbi:MAG: SDR family oxidoreductase [Neomegalonema sp.]|nr:SDR family oxidoreductase [Neomegalonema sp.]
MTGTLFCFGYGYCAAALGSGLIAQGWRVIGTTRDAQRAATMRRNGIVALAPDDAALPEQLARADHLLISAAPDASGDPVLRAHAQLVEAEAKHIRWAGYLSTTGVYGDWQGAWIDESAERRPVSARGAWRVAAEDAWLELGTSSGLPVHVFRLAGIYGPGRGPFEKVREGSARRIIKPGQVFSRIHVEDIAAVLRASMARPDPGAAFNVCDDEPAPPQDVIAHAAELLGLPLPPELDFETADLSPMARSFYGECKRTRNDKIKRDLGVSLRYPTYREGLAALLASEAD